MMSVFFDSGDDQRRQQLQRQRAGPAGGAGGGRGEGGALPGHQGAGPGGDQAYYHVTILSSIPNTLILLQESDNTDCSPACSPHSSLLDAPLPHPPGSAHSSHLGHAHTSIRIQQNSAVRSATMFCVLQKV